MSRQPLTLIAPALVAFALLASLEAGCDCARNDAYSTHGPPMVGGTEEGGAQDGNVGGSCETVGASTDVDCEVPCGADNPCPARFHCEAGEPACVHDDLKHCRRCP